MDTTTNPLQEILYWTECRIQNILKAPEMWGSFEAVEAQFITLMELMNFVLYPNSDPNYTLSKYQAFLREKYPTSPNSPLFVLELDRQKFVNVLQEFFSNDT